MLLVLFSFVCSHRITLDIDCNDHIKDHKTKPDLSETAESNCGAVMNGCDEELSSGVEEKRVNGKEEDTRSTSDRLAACRLSLLEDITSLSADGSTTCVLTTCSNIDRTSTAASGSPVNIDAEDSTPSAEICRACSVQSSSPSSPDISPLELLGSCHSAEDDFRAAAVTSFRSDSCSHPASTAAASLDDQTKQLVANDSISRCDWRRGATTSCRNGALSKDSGTDETKGCSRKDRLSTVNNVMCNDDHPDGLYDKECSTRNKDVIGECSEDKSYLMTSSSLSHCSDVKEQISSVKDMVFTGDRRPDDTVDGSQPQNISDTDTSRPTDASLDVGIKSRTTCVGVGWSPGPTSWSLSDRTKRLQVSSSVNCSPQSDRPYLDLPVIAGLTRHRACGSVLPATLLPRPIIPRSCYRSVRPFLTSSTENSATAGVSLLTSFSQSPAATYDEKTLTASNQTNGETTEQFCVTPSVAKSLNDECTSGKTTHISPTPTDSVEESVISGDVLQLQRLTSQAATTFRQPLTTVAADCKNSQNVCVSSNKSGQPSMNPQESLVIASNSRQKSIDSDIAQVTDTQSCRPVSDSSMIVDCVQSAVRLLRPATLPKPSLSRHAACSVDQSSPSLTYNSREDTAVKSFSASRRTTDDGGGASTANETSSLTKTTSTASCEHSRSSTMNATLDQSLHNTGVQCLHNTRVMADMISNEMSAVMRNECQETNGPSLAGVSGQLFVVKQGRPSTGSVSGSIKLSAEDEGKRHANKSNERKPARSQGRNGEWTAEALTDVDRKSPRLDTEIISLEKGVFGLGFCIEGGRDCPTGRAPVTVKRIFRGRYILMILI